MAAACAACSRSRDLFVAQMHVDRALRHIDRDGVAGAHRGERAADLRFRRDMQDAGAIAGAAHARIGDAQHVAHALLQQLLRDRQHAPFRHARPALRAGIAQHHDVVGRDIEIGIVHAFDISS